MDWTILGYRTRKTFENKKMWIGLLREAVDKKLQVKTIKTSIWYKEVKQMFSFATTWVPR